MNDKGMDMYNVMKLFLFSALLALAACSSDKDAAGGSASTSSTAAAPAADAMDDSGSSMDSSMDKQLPEGPIETPEWAKLEHTVITN